MRKQLDLTALTPSNNDEKVGKKPKVLNVIFSILIVVLVSLFLTGFGYQLWWVFALVLILGLFITLPVCFSSFWEINQQQLIITTYSENGIKKLGQLLGIVKAEKQVIDLSQIRDARIKYEKIPRVSLFNFNPDHLYLLLAIDHEDQIKLDLNNVNYVKLNNIIAFLTNKNVNVYDEQMILQLLAEHKNLFKHFHKKWVTVY